MAFLLLLRKQYFAGDRNINSADSKINGRTIWWLALLNAINLSVWEWSLLLNEEIYVFSYIPYFQRCLIPFPKPHAQMVMSVESSASSNYPYHSVTVVIHTSFDLLCHHNSYGFIICWSAFLTRYLTRAYSVLLSPSKSYVSLRRSPFSAILAEKTMSFVFLSSQFSRDIQLTWVYI